MLTLAVDCALRRINLSALDGDHVLGELSIDAGTKQSELLPGLTRDFLSVSGYGAGDVGHIVVTAGPGYYTGIRVGVSYAAALAESVGASVTAVSSLRAMALPLTEALLAASGTTAVIAPVIPAGRDSLYAAIYRTGAGETAVDGGSVVVMESSYVKTRELLDLVTLKTEPGHAAITGYDLPEELLELAAAYRRVSVISPPISVPRGVLMAARGLPAEDPAGIKAVYLRLPY